MVNIRRQTLVNPRRRLTQLKLRTPFNMFIGGQILDRGITISNLIGFYYGRNPNRFQQDTVLQHSRMYGARSTADLAVTRFYAPQHVYQVMKRIHEFDAALREAFESGAHEWRRLLHPEGRIKSVDPLLSQ